MEPRVLQAAGCDGEICTLWPLLRFLGIFFLSTGALRRTPQFCHWKSTGLWLITQSGVVFFYLNIKTNKKKFYMKVFFVFLRQRDDVPRTRLARADRAPQDAVRGLPGGTEGELGGLGAGDWDEICFSVDWIVQGVVPSPGKPAGAFLTVA